MDHIHVIAPIVNVQLGKSLEDAYVAPACTSTSISYSCVDRGPESIESAYEDALAVPGVVQRALEAEHAGADAVIINCMNDPGMEAARAVVSIPVIGAAQAAMLVASLLAHKFTVIGTGSRDVRPIELLVQRYGLQEKYASTRWVSIPVLDLESDRERLVAALVEQSAAAVREDGAHAIVFGCTVMRSVRDELLRRLAALGLHIPVVDPSLAALKWAETMTALGISHSRRTYPRTDWDQRLELELALGKPLEAHVGQCESHHRLVVVVPVTAGGRTPDWLAPTTAGYCSAARRGTHVEIAAIPDGPSELVTPYQRALAVPELLRLARRAERNGADAVLIDCMADPGLEAAREALDIPVIGLMQASAAMAASIARRFSIIGTEPETLDLLEDAVRDAGLAGKLASVRGTGLTPVEVEKDKEQARAAILREARRAVLKDGAHAIIPGCTDMIGLAGSVEDALRQEGLDVPVLEPPAVAVRVAEALCDMALTQSKVTWPRPPQKRLPGYEDLEYV